ncbi:MAG: polymorphic toxin-type HINT domain-containing protein [Candidatus Omnitrophota bacterium]
MKLFSKRSVNLLDFSVVVLFILIISSVILNYPNLIFALDQNNPPYIPYNPYPANGSIDADVNSDLSWSGGDPDGDPVTYDVFFGNLASPPLVAGNVTNPSYVLDELNRSTAYYWRIKAWDIYGNFSEGPEWNFQTFRNRPPYVPSNPDPYSGATGIPVINTILSWICGDPDQDPLTYDVYFGESSTPPRVATSITENSLSLGELNISTTYNWYVKAWDNYGNFSLSPLWYFETEVNNPPYVPNAPDPVNGTTGIPIIDTILSWLGGDPEGDPVTYDVYFGESSYPPLLATNITQTNLSLEELNFNTTYNWHIEAWDNHGNGAMGLNWTFSTEINNPPNIPEAVYPEHGATGIPIIDTILNWLGGDPDPEDTVLYDLYFGNSTSPAVLAENLTGTSYELGTLNYNSTYYWKVKSTDNHGGYTQGPEWNFGTGIYNNPPVALDQDVDVWIDTPLNITLEATDQEEDLLDYIIVDGSQYGELSGIPPEVTYAPDSGFLGEDGFTFKAYDGQDYSNVANVNIGVYEPYAWSTPERIDTGNIGTQPTLSYSPSGDLRIFYNILNPTTEDMVVRARPYGQTAFGYEAFVYENARTAAVHYDSIDPNTIDLAVETGSQAIILQSTDNGNTWNFIENYAATIGMCGATLPLGFTEDGNNLRLFYGYMNYSGVMGCLYDINYAQRIDNIWDTHGAYFADGIMTVAHENADNVTLFKTAGLHHSTDNGDSFTFIRGVAPEFLDSNDIAVDSNGRIYMLRTYSYGPEPSNKRLIYRYSDDDGTTWSEPQFIITSSKYMFNPHFAVDGNNMVAVWEHFEIPNQNQFVKCIVSEDRGSTWSPPQTIVSLDATRKIGNDYIGVYAPNGSPLDIECHNGKFTVAYSVLVQNPGWDRDGVYITELDLSNTNTPPILAPIGNKSVYLNNNLNFDISATDSDPGVQLTLTAAPLPSGASFVDHGNGTGTFSWTPNSGHIGTHSVTFTASDGDLSDDEGITITVRRKTVGNGCLLSGTPILMADGSTRAIENVQVGDMIMAYDVDNARTIADKVSEVFVHDDADSYLIVNGELKVTANHPVLSNGEWVEIGSLRVGDLLLNQKGEHQKIESIEEVLAKEKVYNFHINPYHTYIANGYVVHNRKDVIQQM